MNRDGHSGANFFTGIEVEHTPAYGKFTLFVVGIQPIQDIQDWLDDLQLTQTVEHIYFGANHSFPRLLFNDHVAWEAWENMIQPFLEKNYFCTLDLDVGCVDGLTEGGLCENINFIPMISVKLPYLQQLGYNATIKIDDRDFRATNPGVWCHSLHSLTSTNNFTHWNSYTKDKIL
jgi:hypothetical protein